MIGNGEIGFVRIGRGSEVGIEERKGNGKTAERLETCHVHVPSPH